MGTSVVAVALQLEPLLFAIASRDTPIAGGGGNTRHLGPRLGLRRMASLDRVRTLVTAASLGLAAPACPPRHPSRLVVVWDQPGDRITVTTVVEERLLDNMVRYSVIRSRAGHGDEVLFAGGTEDYEAFRPSARFRTERSWCSS